LFEPQAADRSSVTESTDSECDKLREQVRAEGCDHKAAIASKEKEFAGLLKEKERECAGLVKEKEKECAGLMKEREKLRKEGIKLAAALDGQKQVLFFAVFFGNAPWMFTGCSLNVH
jgi:hypothetical protein